MTPLDLPSASNDAQVATRALARLRTTSTHDRRAIRCVCELLREFTNNQLAREAPGHADGGYDEVFSIFCYV